jgi:hypothetical protein
MHSARALANEARANRQEAADERHLQEASDREQLALASEERVAAAIHRAQAEELRGVKQESEALVRESEERAERERTRDAAEQRIRERLARQERFERHGLRRFRPGPGSVFYSPGMMGTPGPARRVSEEELDHEIEAIANALEEHGPTDRDALAGLVGARYWGPGRFSPALNDALAEGRIQRISRGTYAPVRREERHERPTSSSSS